jgi:hypothetical protein
LLPSGASRPVAAQRALLGARCTVIEKQSDMAVSPYMLGGLDLLKAPVFQRGVM